MEIRANPRCAGSPMRESNVRRTATTDASREFWKFQLSSSVWRVLEFEALHNRVSKLGDTNTDTRILEVSAREFWKFRGGMAKMSSRRGGSLDGAECGGGLAPAAGDIVLLGDDELVDWTIEGEGAMRAFSVSYRASPFQEHRFGQQSLGSGQHRLAGRSLAGGPSHGGEYDF